MRKGSVSKPMRASKTEVLGAVRRQRARTVALAESLTTQQWETIALPGWRVREVIGHLVSSDEGALKLRMFRVGIRPQPGGAIDAIEQWNETQVRRWSEKPVADLINGLRVWGRRGTGIFTPIPEFVLQRRVPLPFGKVPLLFLGQIRVFDEWVHEQDIRRALSLPGVDTQCTRSAARAMLEVAVTQTPAAIPDGAAGRVVLQVDAPGIPPLQVDLAAKRVEIGARTRTPDATVDATVTADPAALMMVASGRDQWRDAKLAGAFKIEGSRPIAEQFLDVLKAV